MINLLLYPHVPLRTIVLGAVGVGGGVPSVSFEGHYYTRAQKLSNCFQQCRDVQPQQTTSTQPLPVEGWSTSIQHAIFPWSTSIQHAIFPWSTSIQHAVFPWSTSTQHAVFPWSTSTIIFPQVYIHSTSNFSLVYLH